MKKENTDSQFSYIDAKGKCVTFFLDGEEKRAFLKAGFYPQKLNNGSPLHQHQYAEVHMVLEGEVLFRVEGKKVALRSGQILLIPAKSYHSVHYADENTLHSAFGIDFGIDQLVCKSMNLITMKDFFDIIKNSDEDEIDAKLFSYILLVSSLLMDSFKIASSEILEDRFLISEFFSDNYFRNDIQVSDLAEYLHLSEKQTQLLVKRYTGRTFKQELNACRMKMADYLIQETNTPMQEVAGKVGFQTYSGFWKVYRAYKTQNGDDEKMFLDEEE